MATPERPRTVIHEERPYALASEYTVAQIAAVVDAEGSIAEAARKLKLSARVVQAAVDAHASGTTSSPGTPTKPLEAVKDFFGLFAGLAVLVYVLGGVVLFTRLAYEDLPNEAVFGQLPREFLITVGLGQVLLPAALLAAAHAGFRATRSKKDGARNLAAEKKWVFRVAVAWFLAFVAALAWRRSEIDDQSGLGDPYFWAAALLATAAAIAAAALLRWRYTKWGRFRSKYGPRWLPLTLVYGLTAMVAATFIAATFPLLDARACMSAGFAENGELVGQGGDRIFLGEDRPKDRRITSLPASDVEQLFVGDDAGNAICDPRGRAAAVTATEQGVRAREGADVADAQARAIGAAPTIEKAAEPASKLATAGRDAGRATRVVADAAEDVLDDLASQGLGPNEFGYDSRDINIAGRIAVNDADELAAAAARIGTDNAPTLEQLRELAERARGSVRSAADDANRLADEVLAAAQRSGS